MLGRATYSSAFSIVDGLEHCVLLWPAMCYFGSVIDRKSFAHVEADGISGVHY